MSGFSTCLTAHVDVVIPVSCPFQVRIPPFLFREAAKTEAGEPFAECGVHG